MEANLLLEAYLRQLRLSTFLQHYRQIAEDAAQNNLGYDRFLLALAEQELAERERRRQVRYTKAARFPVMKELSDFDFNCLPSFPKQRLLDLAQGGYIARAEPIIMVGHPGLGKTHLAISLALMACRQGHWTRFYNVAALVNELSQAQDDHTLSKFMDTALKFRLIVLDELGFIPFSRSGAHLLFQFCSALHERVAMIITTNLGFADWPQIFGDECLTAALLDRLTFQAHILEFIGESYRFRTRMQREAQDG